MSIINWRLAGNPWNWVKILLMLIIAYIAIELVLHGVGVGSSTTDNAAMPQEGQ